MTCKIINLLIWILEYEIFNFRNRLLSITITLSIQFKTHAILFALYQTVCRNSSL